MAEKESARETLTEVLEVLSEGGELLVDLDVEVVVGGLVGHRLAQPRGHQRLRQRLLTCNTNNQNSGNRSHVTLFETWYGMVGSP